MNTRGEGTVSYDKSKGRWVAKVPVGRGSNGNLLYKKRQTATKAQAQQARRDLLNERDRGATTRPTQRLVGEFALEHLEHEARNDLRETTRVDYLYLANRFIIPEFGGRALASVTSAEIAIFLTHLKAHHSASKVNQVRAVMSRIFESALNHGYIPFNPVRRTKKVRRQHDDRTLVQPHWNLDECRRALEAARDTPFDLFISLAIYTGMRPGEMLGLMWTDVDLEGRLLTVQRTLVERRSSAATGGAKGGPVVNEPKTRNSRRSLELVDDLVRAFHFHRDFQQGQRQRAGEAWSQTGFVFTTRHGEPFWPSNFAARFRRFLADNGLRHIRAHDVRHSFAVNALELGVDLGAVSRALGHAGLQVTLDIYGRGAQGLESRATEGIGRALVGQDGDTHRATARDAGTSRII